MAQCERLVTDSWAPPRPERQCCDKRGYCGIRSARKAHRSAGWRVRVYRCPDCGRYHVTNHEKVG